MTTVILRTNDSGAYDSFTCMGHAGYAKFPFQKDIVCAAVSILVINTVNSLEQITHDEIDVKHNQQTGFIDCRFLGTISHEGSILMDSMVLGLKGIEQEYSKKYFQLKYEEV
ncbi:MAG TPA: ribosomal-processing cysteine protease Prp [Lachnospiraceae bacterium]|nr:ribosomal-processing cysteine protease Prp [Lachnospiraceae bacterium]